ncbi:hypothetical protein [Streptosporangium sp. NPDC002524]|uniref:hypothetical protein n=1 Tax=Streptosporangium sp. NPDC002524 TaxID=3154537 RepID=UPI003323E602
MTELPPAVARFVADADPFERGAGQAADAAKKFGRDADKAALSARKMGIAANEAGERAARAGRIAAEAAEKAARGFLKEERAAELAARAVRELERAEIAQAAAAIASGEASEKAARAQTRQAAAAVKGAKSAALMRGELVTLVAAGVAIAPAFVTAGAGVASFGALAVPTVKKVVEGATKMGETWDSLSDGQKASSASTRMLVTQYKDLTKAVEPDVLRVYNNAVAETARIMPKLEPITRATARALVDLENQMGDALDSDRAAQFFSFVEAQAGPTVHELGNALGSSAHLAASLTESLAPLATTGLSVVGMSAKLLANLSDLSPELAQLAVLGIGLRGPLSSAGEAMGRAGEKYKAATAGASGASKATRLLNVVTAAGPNIYMAAGLAIAYFGLKALNAKSGADRLVESINLANKAMGNNLSGYVAANRALDRQLTPSTLRAAQAARDLTGNVTTTSVQMYQGAQAAQALTKEWVSQAKSDNDRKFANVRAGAAALGKQYNVTAESAVRLATAAGVDLSKGVMEGGNVSADVAAKIKRYSDAVKLANDPTLVVSESWKIAADSALGLKVRTDALNTAMNAFFTPALNVLSASNQMRAALDASNKVLKDGTSTSLERSRALESQLGPLGAWVKAQGDAGKAVSLSDKAIRDQFPSLLRLSKGSEIGRTAVDSLVHSMQGTITRAKGATTIVDRYGNQIRLLPNGKTTVIKADAAAAQAKLLATWNAIHKIPPTKSTAVKANTGQANSAISGVRGNLNSLRDRVVRVSVVYSSTGRATINGTPSVGAFDRGATGGLVTGSGIRRARGGPIDGPGTETSDSIPALLSKNEYVINAKQTRRYLPIIEAINAGRYAGGGLAGYASGGKVTPVGGVDVSTAQWRALGVALGKDFMKGMTGSTAEIASMDRRMERTIAKLFGDKKTTLDTKLIRYLDRHSERLQDLSERRELAREGLKEGKQYAATLTSNAKSFAGLGGLDGPTDARQIRQGLTMKLSDLTRFTSVIKALGKRGLSKSILRQVLDMGPEDGLKYGEMLLSTDKTTFNDLNSTQKALDRASASLGYQGADILYDAGKNAGKGFLTGLNAELKSLDKTMDALAARMAKGIKKSLKIKSPSQLPALRNAGAMTVAGVAAGMDDGLPAVDAAAQRLAARLGQAPGVRRAPMVAVAAAGGGRGGTVVHHHATTITVQGSVWSEAELFKVLQKRSLEHNRRNSSNGLSLDNRR